MREDYLERIENMFPRGFAIVHVNKDGSISFTYSNPEEVEQITDLVEAIEDMAKEDE